MNNLHPNNGSVSATRPDVRIVHLNGTAFRALAQGDQATAEAASPVALSAYLAGPQCRGLWRMRSEQCDQDPTSAAWVTGERHRIGEFRLQEGGHPVAEESDSPPMRAFLASVRSAVIALSCSHGPHAIECALSPLARRWAARASRNALAAA